MPRSQIQWIDGDGGVLDLNNWTSLTVAKGLNNFHNAPFAINSFDVPLQHGAAFASMRVKTRDVDIPLFCMEATRRDFIKKWRSIVAAFSPNKGEGTLRVYQPDGTVRDLKARYFSGLEGATSGASWSPGSGLAVVTLRALDPFWYPLQSETDSFIVTGSGTLFFPFFPMEFASGSIFETAVINNPGDFPAWPIWTINGPGSILTLTNATTGYSLTATLSLALGESVVIDTRPGVKTVRQGSTNFFSTLSSTSVLWSLARGNNTVDIAFNGSDSNSSIDVEFYPPYLSY